MASIKDKIRALRALLRDDQLIEDILAQVELKSLEAEIAGVDVAYKSSEGDGDYDYDGDYDGDGDYDPNSKFLGDLTLPQFGDVMADALQAALAPMIQSRSQGGPLQRARSLPYKTTDSDKTKELDLDQRITDQAKLVKDLVAQVKALGGDVPDAATDTGFFGFLTAGGATVI